jgi:polysaccharide biosynthesis protein PslH
MKILSITYEIPALNGTGMVVRDFNLLTRLAPRYHFSILCYQDKDPEKSKQKTEKLKEFCDTVLTVPRKAWSKGKWSSRIHTLLRIPHPSPWCVRDACSSEMCSAASKLLTTQQFDLIHVNHVEMGPLLLGEEHAKRVIGLESIAPKIKYLLGNNKLGMLNRIYNYSEWQKLKGYEKKLYQSVDLCAMASEVEKEKVLEYAPKANVVVISNGVDIDRFVFQPVDIQRLKYRKIFFFGSLAYLPNQDAVLYFYKEIWPLIREKIPGCTWQIAGPNPPASVLEIAAGDIEVSGWVDDIQQAMAKNSLLVVPLRSGSGTRLKILEAMASGLPVVSTTIGAEGLMVKNGENILLADTPQDFYNQVIRLLQDVEFARNLGLNARRLVENEYNWERVASKLDVAYQELQVS